MTEKLYTGDVQGTRPHGKWCRNKTADEHNHINDQRDAKLAELITVDKERAVKNMASPANIMSDATVGLSAVRAQIVEKNLK